MFTRYLKLCLPSGLFLDDFLGRLYFNVLNWSSLNYQLLYKHITVHSVSTLLAHELSFKIHTLMNYLCHRVAISKANHYKRQIATMCLKSWIGRCIVWLRGFVKRIHAILYINGLYINKFIYVTKIVTLLYYLI